MLPRGQQPSRARGDCDWQPRPLARSRAGTAPSACLTGDLFGSLRCDCGEQLRGSLRIFAESGGGVLLYLAQEGRGIGLGNKLRAYLLQQEGLDTIDADGTLGFGADERRYDAAVEILRYLRIERIRLLTNNPEKLQALQDGGIRVMGRQPLYRTPEPPQRAVRHGKGQPGGALARRNADGRVFRASKTGVLAGPLRSIVPGEKPLRRG